MKFITASLQLLQSVFLQEQLGAVLPLGSISWMLNKINNSKDYQNKDNKGKTEIKMEKKNKEIKKTRRRRPLHRNFLKKKCDM